MQDTAGSSNATGSHAVPDAVRVQVLATGHWSLLATRSMLWNEIFTRTGMFITTLSAAAVALALVAQASDVGEEVRTFTLIILPIVLLLGIGTLLRLTATLEEDLWLVVGRNRLRKAYLGIVPDLEPQFRTSAHDDLRSIMQTCASRAHRGGVRVTPPRVLSCAAVIVSVLDRVLVGLVESRVTSRFTDRSGLSAGAGVTVGLLAAVLTVVGYPVRSIGRLQREYSPRFFAPEADGVVVGERV